MYPKKQKDAIPSYKEFKKHCRYRDKAIAYDYLSYDTNHNQTNKQTNLDLIHRDFINPSISIYSTSKNRRLKDIENKFGKLFENYKNQRKFLRNNSNPYFQNIKPRFLLQHHKYELFNFDKNK